MKLHVVAALLLLSACAPGVRVEGEAPVAPRGPVYVLAYMGDALQRPTSLALTEFSGMTGVRWTSWGDERATGTGTLHGTWCRTEAECARGLPATLVLSGLRRLERTGYYSRFTVTTTPPPGEDLTDGRLEVPPR
ncbi:hypothetical protein [Nonomuraea sp. NPDC050310]|uniref:hypothetical protein n=1 Tax=Nonomuraea sp. NPDC050310 TaxID=3154935 RepID=UPI0033EE6383